VSNGGGNYYLNFLVNNEWVGKNQLIMDIKKLKISQEKITTNKDYLLALLKLEGLKSP
jgi:hypothetical protein